MVSRTKLNHVETGGPHEKSKSISMECTTLNGSTAMHYVTNLTRLPHAQRPAARNPTINAFYN